MSVVGGRFRAGSLMCSEAYSIGMARVWVPTGLPHHFWMSSIL